MDDDGEFERCKSYTLVKLFLVCPHIAQERFLYSYSSATGDIPVNTELWTL